MKDFYKIRKKRHANEHALCNRESVTCNVNWLLKEKFYYILFYLQFPILWEEASSESQQSASDAP